MRLRAAIGRFTEVALDKIRDAKKASVKKLCLAIIRDTPVKTGRLRSNWRFSVGAPDIRAVEQFYDPSTEVSNAIDTLVEIKGQNLFFSNGIPYGPTIEYYGHSQRSPLGMVRLNIAKARFTDKSP